MDNYRLDLHLSIKQVTGQDPFDPNWPLWEARIIPSILDKETGVTYLMTPSVYHASQEDVAMDLASYNLPFLMGWNDDQMYEKTRDMLMEKIRLEWDDPEEAYKDGYTASYTFVDKETIKAAARHLDLKID